MKNLNTIPKTLLYIAFFVIFNILFDKFIFNEKMDAYHLGGATFRGVILALLSRTPSLLKKRTTIQSNSMSAK